MDSKRAPSSESLCMASSIECLTYSSYNAFCGVREREEENVLHALLRCSLVEGVWSLNSFQVRSGMMGGTVGDWWEFCSQLLTGDDWSAFLTTTWEI